MKSKVERLLFGQLWSYGSSVPPEPDKPSDSSPRTSPAVFATTHWSVVLAAGHSSVAGAPEALEKLCRNYWYPLYAFVLRQGHDVPDAQDLTQAFFARFLEKNYLGQVTREKGRFRTFLLASLQHFLANEWDRAHAVKRGGHYTFVPWDDADAENQVSLEWASGLSAEAVYERQWALTLLDQVFARLREECVCADKAQLFEVLRVYLSGEKGAASYAEAAGQLNMSQGAVQVAVHRLRRRYGELLRAEIAHTVSRPGEIDEEIRHLFAALRG